MRAPKKISGRPRNVMDYRNRKKRRHTGNKSIVTIFLACRKCEMLIYKNLLLQANVKCKRAIVQRNFV